ncbi:MAG: archaeosortase/exosortase family protein [Desulfomonile tiedjei]|nr:archaeosortase/exosortase family protein [Desulfomonile tiedjei]
MRSPVSPEFCSIAIQVVALHPVWYWYAARLSDGSDEPWGLGALVAALVFFCLGRPEGDAERKSRLVLPSLLLIVYAAAHPFAPPLLRAAIGIASLACALSAIKFGRVIHPGLLGLCLLSLPVMPTLQFYLGYPFRVLSGMLAAPLLRFSGLPVVHEAACLRWGAELVSIDAPCSGLRMLWACMFLAFILAALRDLSSPRTLLVTAGSLLAALVGNVLRTAALFHLEAGIVNAPAWCHDGVGLVVFAFVAGLVLCLANRIGGRQRSHKTGAFSLEEAIAMTPRPISLLDGNLGQPSPSLRGSGDSQWRRHLAGDFPLPLGVGAGEGIRTAHSMAHSYLILLPSYLIPCLLAALVPFLPHSPAVAALEDSFLGWPTHFDGRPLNQTELSAREEAFARNFPGRIAKFTDGNRTLLVRWVTTETRKLHSAADCFRAMGYRVVPGSLERDGEGRLWSTFDATREGRLARVQERMYDGNGKSWTDVSAWYWAALLGRSRGPWWAITLVE